MDNANNTKGNTMSHCTSCGCNTNNSDDKFCRRCSAKLDPITLPKPRSFWAEGTSPDTREAVARMVLRTLSRG